MPKKKNFAFQKKIVSLPRQDIPLGYRQAKKGAFLGIVANLFLAIFKITIGVIGRSFALVVDGVHSLTDIASSGAVLLGLTVAAKPKDKAHPYGHGKAESLVANSIATLLIIVAVLMALGSIESLFARQSLPQPALITFWAALASVLIKESLCRYKIFLSKKLKSTSLLADAWHHRSDVFSSLVVLVGIGISVFGPQGWHYLDRVAAFFVSVVIIFIAVKIYIKSASELMDESGDRGIVDLVRAKINEVKGVKKIETLLVRKSGLNFLVDAHIEVSPDLNVITSHQIAENAKKKILNEISQVNSVLIHIEPYDNE